MSAFIFFFLFFFFSFFFFGKKNFKYVTSRSYLKFDVVCFIVKMIGIGLGDEKQPREKERKGTREKSGF